MDPDCIDYNKKQANIEALSYYLNSKIPQLNEDLFRKYVDWSGLLDSHDWNWALNNLFFFKDLQVRYKNKALLRYARDQFRDYIWKLETQRRYISISKRDGIGSAIKHLETRYSHSYCKKIEKRMKYLAHKYRNGSCVLLSLTMDPKKFNHDKLLMAQRINKECNRFLTALRIHFKRNNRVFPKFIRTPEFQKNGNCHLHLLFFAATRLIDWRHISKLWGNGFIYINRTNEGQKIRNPINYVTKYITKTFANLNFDNIQTQSLVWLLNMKSFDRSRGLMLPLNPKSSGEWKLDYLVVCDRLNNMIEEIDIINKRMEIMNNPSLWVDPPPNCKGEYIIYADGDEVYSTDSPFWRDFFI